MPLGRLVLPAIRWALRRHTLPDDAGTRYLLRQYILSAYNIAQEFSAFLDQTKPSAAVIFNGIMYPEATARWVAQARGLRVITYEVGFQRHSAFFTEGDATAYPIQIPKDFELTSQQDARLDEYLQKRFQGHFTMAGIRFWPEMRGLDNAFLNKAARFRQIVPVFTNVVYDTSQVHANKVFPHMFAWLDSVLELIHSHPETLFVIRAHPDEMRPGTAKQSRESVRDWVAAHGLKKLPNVVFIDSQEYISSYELIQRAKFVMVYNSSIGIEAVLLEAPVLCGGKARYTQYPMVFLPDSPAAYQQMAEQFLSAEHIEVPPEFQRNARRFLYYQLFRSSLSFAGYLQDVRRKGYVQLSNFPWQALLPENSPTLQVLVDGIAGESLERQARLRSKEGHGEGPLFLTEEEA
jgi:capsule polysaccharide modification protein KpsS